MYLYSALSQRLHRADGNRCASLLVKTSATCQSLSLSCRSLAAIFERALEIFPVPVFTLHYQLPASLEPRRGKQMISTSDRSRIVEMAWEDRTPFEAIRRDYGLTEPEVITLMRTELKPRSFRLWRARVSGRKTKHQAKRGYAVGRFCCPTQKNR